MTEDKNLTPFSIADILKSNDRGGGGGGGEGSDGNEGPGLRSRNAADCSDGALDMTNNKYGVHKKGTDFDSKYACRVYNNKSEIHPDVFFKKLLLKYLKIIIFLLYHIPFICGEFGSKGFNFKKNQKFPSSHASE